MKRKLFDTTFAQYAGLEMQTDRVLKYVAESHNSILSVDELMNMTSSIRSILKTPMAELFDRIINDRQLINFAGFYVSKTDGNLPEILTTQNITLDIKQFSHNNVLDSIPEARDKILINLTGVLKPDRTNDSLSINAIDVFQNLFVRGQFVAAYWDSDHWLTPYLSEFTIKSYSMILSSMISRYFKLELSEQMSIAAIFALFFSQLLSNESNDLLHPPILNRQTWLTKSVNFEEIAALDESIRTTPLDITKVCELIHLLNPRKMQNFSRVDLNAICGNLGPDIITSQIAIEYPPYWLYCLMQCFSGGKLALSYHIKQQNLLTEGRTKFLREMVLNESMFDLTRAKR